MIQENFLIKQKGYLYTFEFCHFGDYQQDSLLNCLKLFLGMENLIKQYQDNIQDWKENINQKRNNCNFKNRKYNFEFKKLKNLNNENMFSELETNCISYLLNNDENNVGKESLGLRNSYAHNIIYYETRIKENQNNF